MTGPRVIGGYRALTYGFQVATDVPELAPVLSSLLQDLRADVVGAPVHRYELLDHGAASRPFTVYVDGAPIERVRSALALVDVLLWHVNRQAISAPDRRIALHAAAVVWMDRGLLLPAPARSGKTTLVAGLLSRGASYLTDEATLIDSEGRVQPYPKPMWMSPGSVLAVAGLRDRLLPAYRSLSRLRSYVVPTDLGAAVVNFSVRVHAVVAPTFRAGSATELSPVSRAEGLMLLATTAFDPSRCGADRLQDLGRVVGGASCYRLTFGDLDEALDLLEGLVRERGEGRDVAAPWSGVLTRRAPMELRGSRTP